jgi:ABC-type multidrug transport system permease subunit
MGRMNEIRELSRVRVLAFTREPEAIFWVFVFPIVLAAVLGFAFREGGVEPSPVGVLDGAVAPAIVEALAAREDVQLETYATDADGRRALRRATVDVLLGAPAAAGEPPALVLDPRRPEAATAELRVRAALRTAAGEPDVALPIEAVTEAGSRYIDFLLPGLLGMNLMGTGMWGIGFAIADVRRRKFLKRLIVTPMRRSSFFLGFINARLVFLAAELVVLVGFAAWVLGVPFRGDIISFGAICLLGAATFAGLGLLTASRARTIEGVSGLMNLVMVPMWLGSGVFFSYERFPDALHPVLQLLPLTALNDALRAVMLDGATVLGQGPQMAVLAGWAVLSVVVALRIFRWQ